MFTAAKSHLQVIWLILHPTTCKSLSPFACLITFLEWLCLWECGVELGGCSEGCKWGMYVCTCRSVSTTCPRTGNFLPAFLPFPHPFIAFAYPRKPAHCQNIRILFLTLWYFCFTWKSQNCKCEYPGEKRKASWVRFIQPFPKENKQAKYIHKNAWNVLWGFLNDSNRGAEVSGFIHTSAGRLSTTFQAMFETVRTC